MSDWELVWVIKGHATWHCQGRLDESLSPGVVLCCRPGDRDGFSWDDEQVTAHGFIHFHFSGERPPDWETWPAVFTVDRDGLVPGLLAHVLHLAQHDPIQARATLRLLLMAVHSGQQSAAPRRSSMDPVIERMLGVLQEAWTDNGSLRRWTTTELASRCGVSRTHLARVCRRAFDLSPQTIERLIRLEHGAILLSRSNLPIQTIADRCGFESPFHFSRCFKECYSVSPRSMRTHIRAGGSLPTTPLVRVQRAFGPLVGGTGGE